MYVLGIDLQNFVLSSAFGFGGMEGIVLFCTMDNANVHYVCWDGSAKICG